MNRKTFLKYSEEELTKLLKKVRDKKNMVLNLLYELKRLEQDFLYQEELILCALGYRKSRRCKLYRPEKLTARCLYYTPKSTMPKKTLFQVYCSTCEVSGMELKLLKEKLMGRR